MAPPSISSTRSQNRAASPRSCSTATTSRGSVRRRAPAAYARSVLMTSSWWYGIEHRDRLVGEQHRRFDGQRAREQHARALADGEPVHAARRELERVGLPHRRRARPRRRRRLCSAAVSAVRQAAERDELARGERPVNGRILRQVRDRARARPAVEPRERRAAPRHRAAVRDEARERAQQRALAGAVRARRARRARRASSASVVGSHGRARFVANLDVRRRRASWRRHAARAELRITRCRKNGAPSSAVTTPSLSSGPGGSSRIATSASVASSAPPRKLGSSSRLGCWPTAAAQQVRHDEADEADDAGDGDRAADGERRAADDEPLRALRIEPEARGRVLAERQRIEAARGRRDEQPARHHQRQRRDTHARGCGRRATRASRTGSRARRTGSARSSARATSAPPRAR